MNHNPDSLMTLDPAEAPLTGTDTQRLSSNSAFDFSREMMGQKEAQVDRRSRIETFFDILCIIGSGNEKPTHIMYKANLSWTVMQVSTNELIRKGLIVLNESDGKKRYRLTDKGRQIRQQYISIKEDLDLISGKRR